MRRSNGWRPGAAWTVPTRRTCTSRPFDVCRPSLPQYAPFPDGARRAPDAGAQRARHCAALHAPGRGHRARARRPPRRRHHADRVGQDALLQRAGPATRSCRIRRAARCICFRPRRSRRISSPSCRRCARRSTRAIGRADRRVHLRRRHAAGRAAHDPRARAPRAQQPRHGALGHPAAPSALGEAVREPALRRHRRAARLSRRVRQPPVQRAAAAAAHLPALRIEPGVPLLVGDDCQPARAGRAADRAAVRARRAEAARRAARSSSSSSTRRSSTSSWASGGRISARRGASRPSSSSATCS